MISNKPLPGIYNYKYLPALAQFILDHHLDEYVRGQIAFSREINLPLLKFLQHFSEEKLIEISTVSTSEILQYLAQNKPFEQIQESLKKWLSNQLEIIGKFDIVAEDITLINFVRGKGLKKWAVKYMSGNEDIYSLFEEIDAFLLASATASTNTYIEILKGRIEEETDFRSKLSNALPGRVYVYDIGKKKEVYSSDKVFDTLGYSKEQLKEMGSDLFEKITHPDDLNKIFEFRKDYLEKNEAVVKTIEYRLKDASGVFKWIRNYETILKRGPEGTPKEIIGVAFDVTEEKKITEALAVREAQLLEAQSLAHIGSFDWDIAGGKSTTNTPEMYKIFELEQMEKFEQFMTHVHKEDKERVEAALKEALKTGDYECEYRYIRNGKEKIIWSKGLITFENDLPKQMVGTVQDVTAIKSIEAELKHKTLELERSNESLQQFAAIASHDLKEPLRKISLFSSKILQIDSDKLSEESKGYINKISSSTSHMRKMMEDLLQLSFLNAKQQKENVNLEDLLSETKELLSEIISEKKATITSDDLPYANVIAPQMQQLFQNLISNSLKFSKDDQPPVISIAHSFIMENASQVIDIEKNGQLEIIFSDNGIGFEQEYGERIFGLFNRLHNKSKYEGSGLGLSICKKIVENHGGTITATSKLGEGSSFKIKLPV